MSKEKIKINDQLYEIDSISQVQPHILRICFSSNVPDEWGDITIYTAGGVDAGQIVGYDTVYRNEGQTVYMSDDGSIYVPPEDPEELPTEPYAPTLEELRIAKRQEVSAACEKIIYNGVSLTLTDSTVEHFSLTEHDQINLFGKQVQLSAGVQELEYHADGHPCRYYSAADMQAIIAAALWHVSYHTTYCNAINMWIAACETAEDVQAIYYGADVPEEYQSEVLKTYLKEIADMTIAEAEEESADVETNET